MNSLIEKIRKIYESSSFIRYFIVGGISWVVDALVLLAINRLGEPFLPDATTRLAVATLSGGVVGFFVNYVLTLVMAFKTEQDRKKGKSAVAFLIILGVSIVGWILKELLMELGVNTLQIAREWIVNIPASAIVLVWNYLGRRLFVFRDGGKEKTDGETDK